MAIVSVGRAPVRLETAPTEGVCDGKPRQYYTNFLNLIPMRIKQLAPIEKCWRSNWMKFKKIIR